MRFAPHRRASVGSVRGRTLHPWSPNVTSGERGTYSLTSSSWVSANDPVAIGFCVPDAATIDQLGIVNGSAAGDNWDFGIYDSSWARLVSTGSQTGTGNSAIQMVDVANTVLRPGRYWAVIARDTTTANRQMFMAGVTTLQGMEMIGAYDSATDAFPLPDPLTNMALATVALRVPIFLIKFL